MQRIHHHIHKYKLMSNLIVIQSKMMCTFVRCGENRFFVAQIINHYVKVSQWWNWSLSSMLVTRNSVFVIPFLYLQVITLRMFSVELIIHHNDLWASTSIWLSFTLDCLQWVFTFTRKERFSKLSSKKFLSAL